MYVQLCVIVLCVTTTIKNITKKILNNALDFVAFFSIQTVGGSDNYGIESPLLRIHNLKTPHFSSLSVCC